MDQWVKVCDYPDYSINQDGVVVNDLNGKRPAWCYLYNGAPAVNVRRDGKNYLRQVSTLMANSWLKAPYPHFNTPIHLDGNRRNCNINNLMLRPRWFAIRYHREMHSDPFPIWNVQLVLLETGEVFNHPREAAVKYGLLQKDIWWSCVIDKPVYPGALNFKSIYT